MYTFLKNPVWRSIMKKIALISLALLLALSLFACTGSGDKEDSIDDYAAKNNTHQLKSETGSVTFMDGPKETAIISGYTGLSTPHKVVIDNEVSEANLEVSGIGDYAFYQLTNVTEVVIPETVTYIGKLAFAGCTELKTIVIPAAVEYIDACAFAGCTSLESVVFEGKNVKYISDYAFQGCENLSEITLPDGLEELGNWAFGGCKSITSIKTPDTLKKIGNITFEGCDGLNAKGALVLSSSIEEIGEFAFAGINKEYIVAPEGSHAAKYVSDMEDTKEDAKAEETEAE